MCLGWCALVCAAAAISSARSSESSSDEELRQALVLIDILKSGYGRLSSPAVSPPSEPITRLPDYMSYVQWPPPPYSPPYYGYGRPFRRFYENTGDIYNDPLSRRSQKLARQFEYDDPFGPHPGGDFKGKKEEKSTSTQSSTKSSTLSSVTTNSPTTAVTETTTTKTTIEETTEATKVTTLTETIATTTTKASPGRLKNVITKRDKVDASSKPTLLSTVTVNKIKKLSYEKKGKSVKKINEDIKTVRDVDQPELAQVAEELKREAADTADSGEHKCNNSITTQKSPCPRGTTKATAHKNPYPWRFRGTTRIYLSRSFRPAIPLPDNNPFCHTNPESPLCRTFI